jgi:molybdopterin-guanine dinucleotide biosynthesis protein A
VARRPLTGVLLVGGASRRFGAPKALAQLDGETLAERGWRLLGEACDERLAVGKPGELDLPFPLVDDGTGVRAALAGVVAGLRAARHDVAVVVPVDCPWLTADVLHRLGDACEAAAVPQTGPLPGAWSKDALPVLERRLAAGEYTLRDAAAEVGAVVVEVDEALLADVDTPDDLAGPAAARSA